MFGGAGPVGVGKTRQVGTDRGEEHIAQASDQFVADDPGVATPRHHRLHRDEGLRRIAIADRLHEFVDAVDPVGNTAGGHHPIERTQGVPGRAATGAQDVGPGVGGDLQSGIGDHVIDEPGQIVGGEERHLEVLGAAPDGGQHFLRIGGGEHEHDVIGRFLEGLQQRVRRRRRQHVHLVEDVHLGAPGRTE